MSRDLRPSKCHNNEGKPTKNGMKSKSDPNPPAPIRIRTQQQLMEHLEISNSIMENETSPVLPAQSTYLATNMAKKNLYAADKKDSPSHEKKKAAAAKAKRGSMRPRRRSSDEEKPKPRQRGSTDERNSKPKAQKHRESEVSNQTEPAKTRRPTIIRRDVASDQPQDIAKKRRPTITIQGEEYEIYRYIPRERWERIKDREVNCEIIGMLRRVQPEHKEEENKKPRKKPTKSKTGEKSESSPCDDQANLKRKSPEEKENE